MTKKLKPSRFFSEAGPQASYEAIFGTAQAICAGKVRKRRFCAMFI
jgi:hypothetical protein